MKSCSPFDGFQFAVRLTGMGNDGGNCNSKQTDVGKGVQVFYGRFIPDPHTLLSCIFKTGVIAFAFRTKGITAFKISAVPVYGKP